MISAFHFVRRWNGNVPARQLFCDNRRARTPGDNLGLGLPRPAWRRGSRSQVRIISFLLPISASPPHRVPFCQPARQHNTTCCRSVVDEANRCSYAMTGTGCSTISGCFTASIESVGSGYLTTINFNLLPFVLNHLWSSTLVFRLTHVCEHTHNLSHTNTHWLAAVLLFPVLCSGMQWDVKIFKRFLSCFRICINIKLYTLNTVLILS